MDSVTCIRLGRLQEVLLDCVTAGVVVCMHPASWRALRDEGAGAQNDERVPVGIENPGYQSIHLSWLKAVIIPGSRI